MWNELRKLSQQQKLDIRTPDDELKEQGIKVMDSSHYKDEDYTNVGNALIGTQGRFVGWHVTSNPEAVYKALQSGSDITQTREEGKYGDLGSGFYFSAAPQLWAGRATKKWDFLNDLDKEARTRLADVIRVNPNLAEYSYDSISKEKIKNTYLTKTEREYALRQLDDFVERGGGDAIVQLAGQPYNISFWKKEFLEPLGIEQKNIPQEVPVEVVGKFLDVTNYPGVKWEITDQLKGKGFDGAFVQSGFSNVPQVVVWNSDAIKRFGDFVR